MTKKRLLIVGGIVIIMIAVFLFVFDGMSLILNRIPTEGAAINLATEVSKEKYPDLELGEYEIKVINDIEHDDWIVFWYYPNTLGGGGPAVHIDKKTGDVHQIYRQK